MNRREFIKSMGKCIALTMIPPGIVASIGKEDLVITGSSSGNHWVSQSEMAKEALRLLEKHMCLNINPLIEVTDVS